MREYLTRFAVGGALQVTRIGCPTTPTGSVLGEPIVGGDATVARGTDITVTASVETTGSVAGTTSGALEGVIGGGRDAFVRSYGP